MMHVYVYVPIQNSVNQCYAFYPLPPFPRHPALSPPPPLMDNNTLITQLAGQRPHVKLNHMYSYLCSSAINTTFKSAY